MADPSRPNRNALAAASLAVAVILIALGILYVNKANGSDRAAAIATANPSPSVSATNGPPTPASTATAQVGTQIAFADCGKSTFGPNLQPADAPADIHVYAAEPAFTIDAAKLYRATIHTAKGDIVLCLQPALAPHTVNNFVTLARNHFYDGLKFHRVVASFVIQGGDPQGTGNGGPGYQFSDEPVRQKYVLGAVAMANSGVNTNGSQFFIDIADDSAKLQPLYNLFGNVQSGQDVANNIAQGDVMVTVTVAESQ